MAGARANWKGFLTIGEIACPVALYTAASTSERIAFHMINRKTGNRVHRIFVDPQTGKEVDRADQVKGYALDDSRFVMLEPDEIAKAVPDSDKRLAVDGFIPCDQVDTLYFDRPYYLTPADKGGLEAFSVIRDAMQAASVAALARAVLFRRVRSLLIRPDARGLIAHTLNYDYEVRAAGEAFEDLPDIRIQKNMLELARHIVETKKGEFDPAGFDDRYEAAVADLVRAKLAGKPLKRAAKKAPAPVIDLMAALRESAGLVAGTGTAGPKRKTAPRKSGTKRAA
ncbi:Ku protein [Phreatobacter oligotrophus]|jgi:DNA end-binding protein Ku|uniref:Non-homologous end joining protein Ku n=1 Tax=Phreatobacter oligotrophus TaxID=1122261 RepID=A0A2T4Z6D1_9HYPH|nr:Ku protein [Phreatobacter oligotrophus]PTM57447.1 DNA end-binding protein Ku [Phreatobacter oligotrophus]